MIIPKNLSLSHYEFILSENCNLRCKYCFDNYRSDREQNGLFNMPISMIPDLLYFIDQTKSKDDLFITLFGGEPTLNWDFIEFFVKELKNKYKNVEISIVTNTTLLTSEKIDFIANNDIGVTASIDGIREANVNRINKNGDNSWDSVMKVLPELLAKTKKINLSMVVNNDNYIYLYDSYKFLLKLHDNVEILFDLHNELSDSVLLHIENSMRKLFIEERLIPYRGLRKITNPLYKEHESICAPANRSISINYKGDLYFCHQFVPKMQHVACDPACYGNIYDGFNLDIYEKFYNRSNFKSIAMKDNICKECSLNWWCKGGCMAENWFYDNNFNKINTNICRINKKIDVILKELQK